MKMYFQQEQMHRTGEHRCADRIISIFQPHVRPIVRGKAGAKVEFGAKIGVSLVEGYNFIDHHSWDAYNECNACSSTSTTTCVIRPIPVHFPGAI